MLTALFYLVLFYSERTSETHPAGFDVVMVYYFMPVFAAEMHSLSQHPAFS